MQKYPDIFRGAGSGDPDKVTVSQSFEGTDLALLALKQELLILNEELLLERNRVVLIRELLRRARLAIIDLRLDQHKKKRYFFMPRLLSPTHTLFYRRGGSKHNIYISRSSLEKSVFAIAKTKVRHIIGVVIDFKPSNYDAPPPNWHIIGVVSGSADPTEALAAVKEAALQHVTCVMVEDGSRLDGRSIKTG